MRRGSVAARIEAGLRLEHLAALLVAAPSAAVLAYAADGGNCAFPVGVGLPLRTVVAAQFGPGRSGVINGLRPWFDARDFDADVEIELADRWVAGLRGMGLDPVDGRSGGITAAGNHRRHVWTVRSPEMAADMDAFARRIGLASSTSRTSMRPPFTPHRSGATWVLLSHGGDPVAALAALVPTEDVRAGWKGNRGPRRPSRAATGDPRLIDLRIDAGDPRTRAGRRALSLTVGSDVKTYNLDATAAAAALLDVFTVGGADPVKAARNIADLFEKATIRTPGVPEVGQLSDHPVVAREWADHVATRLRDAPRGKSSRGVKLAHGWVRAIECGEAVIDRDGWLIMSTYSSGQWAGMMAEAARRAMHHDRWLTDGFDITFGPEGVPTATTRIRPKRIRAEKWHSPIDRPPPPQGAVAGAELPPLCAHSQPVDPSADRWAGKHRQFDAASVLLQAGGEHTAEDIATRIVGPDVTKGQVGAMRRHMGHLVRTGHAERLPGKRGRNGTPDRFRWIATLEQLEVENTGRIRAVIETANDLKRAQNAIDLLGEEALSRRIDPVPGEAAAPGPDLDSLLRRADQHFEDPDPWRIAA